MTHTHTTYHEAVHAALHLLADDMGYEIPTHADIAQERAYLRALMNLRDPAPLPDGYPEAEAIVLDITRLEVDAIVNAANSALLGCRAPGHTCIDNAIHSAAGLELRQACADVMAERARCDGPSGFPTGEAVLTPGFHLPSRFVIHTVGPIVSGELTDEHREALARSYRRCLEEAAAHGLNTVAFCCISTGVFGFPQEEAARIAVATVADFLESDAPGAAELCVIVDVFGDRDEALYRALLGL